MSLLDTLTTEDLEKAASARLFAEAAAAEGIDLSELNEDQVDDLYTYWATGDDETAKVAAAEEYAVKEAQAKLAEADYIGRYMAHAYADELSKLAEEEAPKAPVARSLGRGAARGALIGAGLGAGGSAVYNMGQGLTARDKALSALLAGSVGAGIGGTIGAGIGGLHGLGREQGHAEKQSSIDALIEARAFEMLKEAAEEAAAAPAAAEAAEGLGDRVKRYGKSIHDAMGTGGHHLSMGRLEAGSAGAKALGYGASAAALGGLGYGAKKLLSKKEQEKQSSIDYLIEARALEMLKEAAGDRSATQAAKDLLLATNVRKNVAEVAGEGAGMMDKARAYARILRGTHEGPGAATMTTEARRSLGAQGGALATLGAAGYGAKKLHDKRKHEKQSSALDELALARAQEIAEEIDFSDAIDNAALELLAANGYV